MALALLNPTLKGGPSDLGTKIFRNTKKASLYLHKTIVVENHPKNKRN